MSLSLRRTFMRPSFFIPLIALTGLFCLSPTSGLFALSADLEATEITLVLRPDGKADVTHELDWNVSDGTMGGFYFQGEKAPFAWNPEKSWSDLADGTRSALDIKRAGDKWDVLLDRGKRSSGRAHWVLSYGADLAAADLIGLTDSAEFGRLLFFHWAPTRWDEALDHRTTVVVLPVETVAGSSGDSRSEYLTELGFVTEGFVKEENRIDWFAVEGGDGKHYLALRFHQEPVDEFASQELNFYFSVDAVSPWFSPLLATLDETDIHTDVLVEQYNIGSKGPAGGIIFYDKGPMSNGWRYLEAAPTDQSTGVQWCNGDYGHYFVIVVPRTWTGYGDSNTRQIISHHGAGNYAAALCDELVWGGFDDWFLPSLNELYLMYTNLNNAGRGDFEPAWYWSSSESEDGCGAWLQDFDGGGQLNDDKYSYHSVRAVRAF